MGVLTDYFSAPSDEAAATAIDRVGGPALPTAGSPVLPPFDAVQMKGIDPYINLGTLESILTGLDYDAIVADPNHAGLIAQRDDDGPWVCAVSATLQEALATADSAQLARAAVPWSQTEEFHGAAPESLMWVLEQLADLARRATANGHRLYCWACL
jgi:hypothetical protein